GCNLVYRYYFKLKVKILIGGIGKLSPRAYVFFIVIVHDHILYLDAVQCIVENDLVLAVSLLVQEPGVPLETDIRFFQANDRFVVFVEGVIKVKVVTVIVFTASFELCSKEQGILEGGVDKAEILDVIKLC